MCVEISSLLVFHAVCWTWVCHVIIGTMRVSLAFCGSVWCLRWYSWSPIAKPGQPGNYHFWQNSMSVVASVLCMECILVRFHVCTCVCVCVKIELADLCLSNICAMVGDCRESFHQPKQKNHKAAIPQAAAMLQAHGYPLSQSKQVLLYSLYISTSSDCPAISVKSDDPYRPCCNLVYTATEINTEKSLPEA